MGVHLVYYVCVCVFDFGVFMCACVLAVFRYFFGRDSEFSSQFGLFWVYFAQ